MSTATIERCRRCATQLRNQRQVCPCCGWDLAEAEASEGKPSIKKVAAKAGVKMCPVCMSSIPEEQLVEYQGQKLCSSCADGLKNKAAKKAAAAAAPKS